jgi:NTE family protein
MDEAGYQPDVVSGISIGAFTAALIAGNEPKDRVAKLKEFWKTISYPDFAAEIPMNDTLRRKHNMFSSMQGMLFGQPKFFEPRNPVPQLQKEGTIAALSYYDTSPLRDTLLKFVDFDRINRNATQLLLGAVKVSTGELVFFDSKKIKIGPEHVMASGSMPPGFPPMVIDGDMYWDGGCVSNTPLEGIFNLTQKKHTLAFMIDLFSPEADEPKNMDDVSSRSKDILYSSRTAHHIGHVTEKHNMRKAVAHLIKSLGEKGAKDPIIKELMEFSADFDFDIAHSIYRAPAYEVSSKDCEFSRMSITDRASHGYADMQEIFAQSPWLKSKRGAKSHKGSAVYKFSSKGTAKSKSKSRVA